MTGTAREFLENSISVKQSILKDEALMESIQVAASKMADCVHNNGTIYVCGNGGSSCDAMHFAEELVARYKRERRGYRAMHFSDPGVLTCWSNDYDYESAFARQAETFCSQKDLLVGISTSGNSENVLQAINTARAKNCFTIGLLGKNGGKIAPVADLSIVIPSDQTDRIQESHITLIHIFCEIIETSER